MSVLSDEDWLTTFWTAIPMSLAPLRANIMEEQLAEGPSPGGLKKRANSPMFPPVCLS